MGWNNPALAWEAYNAAPQTTVFVFAVALAFVVGLLVLMDWLRP